MHMDRTIAGLEQNSNSGEFGVAVSVHLLVRLRPRRYHSIQFQSLSFYCLCILSLALFSICWSSKKEGLYINRLGVFLMGRTWGKSEVYEGLYIYFEG